PQIGHLDRVHQPGSAVRRSDGNQRPSSGRRVLCSAKWPNDELLAPFFDANEGACWQACKLLRDAAWPIDPQAGQLSRRADAKVEPARVLRQKPRTGPHFLRSNLTLETECGPRAYRVAIAFPADKLQCDRTVRRSVVVPQYTNLRRRSVLEN